jgi:hypothetical protein
LAGGEGGREGVNLELGFNVIDILRGEKRKQSNFKGVVLVVF